MTTYRPVPGKLTVDSQNRIVTVKRYGSDSSGEYVEVQLYGSYGAHVRLPVSCIRPLTDEERQHASNVADADFALSRKRPKSPTVWSSGTRSPMPSAPKRSR